MEPAEALADLKQISTQVERAVIVRDDGSVEASTLGTFAAEAFGANARELWRVAEVARSTLGRPPLSQLEVATPAGSVFAVRDDERLVCAVTGCDPTVGLIFYDLKTCLRNVAEDPAEPGPVEEASDDGET